LAKGRRFDSMQDVYNMAVLEKYALIHYIHALDKFVRNKIGWRLFDELS